MNFNKEQFEQFGGKGSSDANKMSCMFMMVPTAWGQPGGFQVAQIGGKGCDNATYGNVQQMGMVPNHHMAGWQHITQPQHQQHLQ
jgi:hypothetical protein